MYSIPFVSELKEYITAFEVVEGNMDDVYILIIVFSSSCLVFFIGQFVHSTSAFLGLSTIVGFIVAIYLPLGMLPETVQKALKCIPVLYGSSLMRESFTSKTIKTTFYELPKEAAEKNCRFFK